MIKRRFSVSPTRINSLRNGCAKIPFQATKSLFNCVQNYPACTRTPASSNAGPWGKVTFLNIAVTLDLAEQAPLVCSSIHLAFPRRPWEKRELKFIHLDPTGVIMEYRRMPRVGRRQFIQLGASGLLIPDYFNLRAHSKPSQNSSFAAGFGQAKSCIVLFAWGGLSPWTASTQSRCGVRNPRNFSSHQNHCSGYSGKRASPPIRPNHARMGDRPQRSSQCPQSSLRSLLELTGHEPPNLSGNWPASRADWPSIGSMVWEALGDGHGPIPGTVALPYTTTVKRPTDRTRAFLD